MRRASPASCPVIGTRCSKLSATRTWSCRCTSGPGFGLIKKAEEAPIDHLIILTCQIAALIAQDLLFGPTLRRFPDLKVALSEGGIGWIPFYLDRADRHFQNQAWLHNDFGGRLPSDVFRDHILACYITDPSGLELRRRIGIDNISWECDYPHTDTTWPESPEFTWKELQEVGATDEEIHKITWENSCRFFDWDPFRHTPKDRRPSRGFAHSRRTSTRPGCRREEWKKRNESAGIGTF